MFHRRTAAELIGARLPHLLPSLRDSALFADFVQVVETGSPLSHVRDIHDTDVHGTFEGLAAKLGDGLVVTYRGPASGACLAGVGGPLPRRRRGAR